MQRACGVPRAHTTPRRTTPKNALGQHTAQGCACDPNMIGIASTGGISEYKLRASACVRACVCVCASGCRDLLRVCVSRARGGWQHIAHAAYQRTITTDAVHPLSTRRTRMHHPAQLRARRRSLAAAAKSSIPARRATAADVCSLHVKMPMLRAFRMHACCVVAALDPPIVCCCVLLLRQNLPFASVP